MSTEIEQQMADVLGILKENRLDTWGLQAGRMADGIRQSGLVERQGEIVESLSDVRGSISSLAAVMGQSFGDLARQLVNNNRMLQRVIDSLRNPLDTQADERYRRGVTALQHSWFPEAVSEFSAALEANPYQPLAHVLLGIAQAEENDRPGAIASFKAAYRYGTPGEPEIATGAAILAISAIEQGSGTEAALEFLKDALMTYRGCADLGLIHSRLAQMDEFTKPSLWLAPELAVPAMAGGSIGVPEASAMLVPEVGGPVKDAVAIKDAVERFAEETDDEPAALLPTVCWSALEHDCDAELMTGAGQVLLRGPEILNCMRAAHTKARQTDEYNLRQLQYKLEELDREIASWTRREDSLLEARDRAYRKAIPSHIGAVAVLIVFLVLAEKFGGPGAIGGLVLIAAFIFLFYAGTIKKLLRAEKDLRDHSGAPEPDQSIETEKMRIDRRAANRDTLLSEIGGLVGKRAHRITPWSRVDYDGVVNR
ncbi:tetratricopeptide repeat protein [Rhodococcus koreensis]